MTGQPDQPNVARRRHLDRMRAGLDLTGVPPNLGVELRALTPLVRDRLRASLQGGDDLATPPSGGSGRLLAVLARAAEEFASIVEDRPPPAPPVEALVGNVVLDEGPGGLHALEEGLGVVRQAMCDLWEQLPHARCHAARLEAALTRYAARLLDRATIASRSRSGLPPGGARAEGSRPEGSRTEELLAEVEHRWGGTPLQVGVTDGAHHTSDPTTNATARRPLRLVGPDHFLVVAEHPGPAPGAPRPTAPGAAEVWVGSVPPCGVAAAYETALVRFRLVRAGVAAPPAALLPLPDLGFLRLRPDRATIEMIAALVGPLRVQHDSQRVVLARTMRLRLRTTGTVQAMAGRLQLHPQTVSTHLTTLRALYGEDLDRGGDTLATLAALDMVLPLWELEDDVPPSGRVRSGNSPETAPGETPVP